MTALRKPTDTLTPAEYLALEATSPVKHEYSGGHLYAMAGASDVHNEICLNIATALRTQLRGKPCRTFMAEMRLKIVALVGESYYYPDVMVACDPSDADPYCRERPTLLAEVLSPSTTRADFDKFFVYQHLPALAHYLLVAQDRREVIAFHRPSAAGEWQRAILNDPAAEIDLHAIGARLSLAQVYDGIAFAAPPAS